MYSAVTLDQLAAQLGTLLDDPGSVYWTQQEKYFAIQESLRVWGAMTSFWRSRGAVTLGPRNSNFLDLSQAFSTLRPRTWTLQQMTQEIQFALLEPASGISGAGMSGQVSIGEILQAIQRARNRFVLDTRLPLSVHSAFGGPPPSDGLVTFDQSAVFVHRASWQDTYSGVWNNLWREDAWSVDKGATDWTQQPGGPREFSEAELSPLQLQLSPPPVNEGQVQALTVDSLTLDLTNPAQTFDIPDEWIWAVKYAALSQIFSSGGQIADPLRSEYAEQRYQSAVNLSRETRSVIRVLVNNVPLPIDSLESLDAGNVFWQSIPVDLTQPGQSLGVLYDIIALPPLASVIGLGVDMVAAAPVPLAPGAFIPIGLEDLDHLVDYATTSLMFKCGGNELKSSLGGFDAFQSAAAFRGSITKAKIRYLQPLLGQPQKEWSERPDFVGA